MNVLVWYKNRPLPEAVEAEARAYPKGVHGALGELLVAQGDMTVRAAVMQDDQQGFSDENLAWADVLVCFGHKHWREVADDRVDLIQKRVLDGMGLVLLHSSHASKIFARLMGTRTQCLRWRENDEWQRVWAVMPFHPIAHGLETEFFTIPQDETYGEYFEIPQPDEQVFLTTSQGGRGAAQRMLLVPGSRACVLFFIGSRNLSRLLPARGAAHFAERRALGYTGVRRKTWPDWARESPLL